VRRYLNKLVASFVLALLLLSGGASANGIASVQLTLQVNHTVVLQWSASVSSGVTGYNVYRGTVSGGPYTKIVSDMNALDYNDTSVQASKNYFYVVTAMDSSGLESTYSNEASAAIP
jgi:fibronectin type 3 domain-containing protein